MKQQMQLKPQISMFFLSLLWVRPGNVCKIWIYLLSDLEIRGHRFIFLWQLSDLFPDDSVLLRAGLVDVFSATWCKLQVMAQDGAALPAWCDRQSAV